MTFTKDLALNYGDPSKFPVRSRSELVELKDKRLIYATSLQSAIDSNSDVIYMDETTVSSFHPLFNFKFVTLKGHFLSQ